MRFVRLLLLTFLFSLLLVGIQVLILCLVFVIRIAASNRATGVGVVVGAWREVAMASLPLVAVAAFCAWWAERYWRHRAAAGQPENRAPLL